MNSPYDDPHGDLLGRVLKAEADRVMPAGDGLTRIRERVERRRSRGRWLMPAAALGTAAALTGVGFGAYHGLSGGGTLRTPQVGHSGSGGPTATQPGPSPSTLTPAPSSAAPVITGTSLLPVWPFSSSAQVQLWQQQYASGGSQAWHLDATYTATAFVDSLQLPQQRLSALKVDAISSTESDVHVATSTTGDGKARELGVVHLVRWGSGSSAPWEVTGVTTSAARIDSPTAGATVGSPLKVVYTLDGGAEEDVYASAWDGTGRLSSGHRTVGGGQLQAGLAFGTPRTANGYVVIADIQGASGHDTLTRLVVTPVRYSGASTTTATGKHYPPFFLAVSNDRIALYYSTLGGFGRYVTAAHAGTVSSPQLSADGKWVYFLRSDAGATNLMRVPIGGGAEQTAVSGVGNITTYAIGGQEAERLVYATRAADGSQQVHWSSDVGGSGSLHAPSAPPLYEQFAWAPDGRHFTTEVRSGNGWGLRTYATTATSFGDGVPVPSSPGMSNEGPSYDAAGKLYYIRSADAYHYELVQYTGTQVLHVSTFTLPAGAGSPEATTVDMTPDAYAGLVSTSQHQVYRVDNGTAHLLPTDASSATW